MDKDNELVFTVTVHAYGDADDCRERIKERLEQILALKFMTVSVDYGVDTESHACNT